MSTMLDKLVNVDISITTAVPDAASFGYMLIVGPAPTKALETAPDDVAAYSGLDAVTEAGWDVTTDPVGKAALVAFAGGADKVYIAVRKEEAVEASEEGGETTMQPEAISTTLARAAGVDGWYAVALLQDATEDDITLADAWVNTQNKICGYTTKEKKRVIESDTLRTFAFYTQEGDYNDYAHVAWFATCLQYTAGSETWAYKQLTQITPSAISATEAEELEELGLNYYIACAGRNITLNGKMIGGEWIDTVRFRDWLQNDMQKRIYNLFVTNPKVPFTNAGIGLIENQITASLKTGTENGGIAPTEYDADGNEVRGFSVSVPNAVNVSASEKAARTLSNCKFSARLAGAIHATEIKGNLVT